MSLDKRIAIANNNSGIPGLNQLTIVGTPLALIQLINTIEDVLDNEQMTNVFFTDATEPNISKVIKIYVSNDSNDEMIEELHKLQPHG